MTSGSVNFRPCGANSYASLSPAIAVTLMVLVAGMARGGTTIERPASGMAIVPPRMPMFFETVIDFASGVLRCAGVMVFGEPRRVVMRLADDASGATLGAEAGVDGEVL